MASEVDYNIIVDCIAEELDKIQANVSDRELFSIDLLSLATELFDPFETILNIGLAVHKVVHIIRTSIKDTASQKGVNMTDGDIDNILKAISQRLNSSAQNQANER